MLRYYVSAVVNNRRVEDNFIAKSGRQAWYLFCKKYSFKNLDFTIHGTREVA